MLSVNDFVKKYELYSDEELIEIYLNVDNYSKEANEALSIVLQEKGGIEAVEKRLADKKIIADEINRIEKETVSLSSKETTAEFIKTLITSEILPREKVENIINIKFLEFEAGLKDASVDSKTITKAILASVIASLIGGVFVWVVLAESSEIPILFFIALAVFCYVMVRWITKKTKANTAVLLASFLSFIIAFLIGYGLTATFGKLW